MHYINAWHVLTHRNAVQWKAVQLYAAGLNEHLGICYVKGDLGRQSSTLVEIGILDGNFDTDMMYVQTQICMLAGHEI